MELSVFERWTAQFGSGTVPPRYLCLILSLHFLSLILCHIFFGIFTIDFTVKEFENGFKWIKNLIILPILIDFEALQSVAFSKNKASIESTFWELSCSLTCAQTNHDYNTFLNTLQYFLFEKSKL